MTVTVRKPKWLQEMLIWTLLPAGLGLLAVKGWAAEPPTPAKNPPLSEAIRGQIARLQLETDLKELVQVRSELRKTAIELDVLQAEMRQQADTVGDEAIELAVDQDLGVRDSTAELKKLRDDLKQLEKTIAGGRNSSIYKDEQTKLQVLERELAARRRKLRPTIENELRQKSMVEVGTRIKSCRQRVTIAKELEKKLVADIQQLSGETGAPVPANEDRLRVLEREVKDLKDALEALRKQTGRKE
jgi:hypothetical protein